MLLDDGRDKARSARLSPLAFVSDGQWHLLAEGYRFQLHRRDAVAVGADEVERRLRETPAAEGEGDRGQGEIADAQAVVELGAAGVAGVAHFDQVLAVSVERAGEPAVGAD